VAILSLILKVLIIAVLLCCLYVWYWVDTMRVYGDENDDDLNEEL